MSHRKKAWMDCTLFEKLLQKLDWQMNAANQHILLFVDGCTSHVSLNGLTNIKLIFFPPNCTSWLQPADQGIIQNLKIHYYPSLQSKQQS